MSQINLAQTQTTAVSTKKHGVGGKNLSQENSIVNHITLKSIGPSTMGGRVVDLAVNEKNPLEFYVAYATGGVWYTCNNGQSFTAIFDSADAISIGAIAVNWNTGRIWVGTGEAGSQDSRAGNGVFISDDTGKTWRHSGLAGSNHISKIILDPSNDQSAWVAVMGQITGGGKRGIYKTTDGGSTWNCKLFKDNQTGAIDMAINPLNVNEVYVALWHRTRTPWSLGSGETSGIYKSIDGGDNWTLLSTEQSGFPTGNGVGRIGLAVYRRNPKTLYAVVDNRSMIENSEKKQGIEVYRSENAGLSWGKVNTQEVQGGFYFGKIYVSPYNDQKVVVAGETLSISLDGGKTYIVDIADHKNLHVDHHALWINPINDDHMISGNDGGCNITYDGIRWGRTNSPSVGQFVSVTVDNATPYNVYGGLQDNGVWYGPSDYNEENLNWYSDHPFKMLLGSDGMHVQVDTRDNTTVYTGWQYGSYARLQRDKNLFKQLVCEKYDIKYFSGLREDRVGVDLRFNRKTPILLSRHNQDIIYYGANVFFRSLNKADTLIALSKDLTNGPKEKDSVYGMITGAILSIAESPLHFGLLYVGTDDGNIQLSKDGGYNWNLLNDPKKKGNIIPKEFSVTSIAASRFKEGTVYVALNGREYDIFSPYLFTSSNFGSTWKQIGKTLPNEPINVVKEDSKNENVLYVGTDGGLYVSLDKGESFTKWNAGLPKSVIVSDIAIQEHENEIVIATYGRSLYKAKLDEIQKLASTQHNK